MQPLIFSVACPKKRTLTTPLVTCSHSPDLGPARTGPEMVSVAGQETKRCELLAQALSIPFCFCVASTCHVLGYQEHILYMIMVSQSAVPKLGRKLAASRSLPVAPSQ